jgi:hypothetical protein
MPIDSEHPVVELCAAGMAAEGTPAEARRLFEQAWAARRDDYDACIAAHFLARHQGSADSTLHWNALAVRHAEAVTDGRAAELYASLYLNLGDAHAALGQSEGGRGRRAPCVGAPGSASGRRLPGVRRARHRSTRPTARARERSENRRLRDSGAR